MVENQHSINTVLSFSVKSVNPEILEKLLIGREKTADYLLDSVKAIAEHGNNQQILVVGHRGMGKTHLLRVLFHKIQDYINEKKIVVAYFAEEEYGVANYFDFLMRIVNALLKWRMENNDFLEGKIKELQTFHEKYSEKIRENYLEKVIEDYLDYRPLLILAENFSDILKSINVKEQAKLRSWLYTVNRISIIATSQALSRDFDSEDRPFYGFFNIYFLKNLSYEDSVKFLVALAEVDHRPDIAKFLQSKGQNQIRALHQLVKGNHRLLVTFYSFLKTDTLVNLSVNFIKTINDLKPYYETFIRFISPQQQKILRYIALSRKPKQGTEISKNCFIEQKSTSKELSELVRKGLLEAITDPNDKRNKLYDINEPLLRISIEVGEHKEGITALFIDFLAAYYNERELIKRKDRFSELSKHTDSSNEKLMFSYELTAIDKALELKYSEYNSLASDEEKEIIDNFIKDENYDELFTYWFNKKIVINKEDFYRKVFDFLFEQKNYKKSIIFIKKLIELNPKDDYAYNFWGIALSGLAELKNDEKLYLQSIEKYKKAIELDPYHAYVYYNWGNTLFYLAELKNSEKSYLESSKKYKKAIEIKSNYENAYNNWGSTLNRLAELKKDEKLYLESIEKFKKAVELKPNFAYPYNNWGNSLFGLAELKKDEKLYLESIDKLKKAVELKPNFAYPYNNWGNSLSRLAELKKDEKLYLESIDKYKKAVKLKPDFAAAYYNWGNSLLWLAELKNDEKLFSDSIEKYIKAIDLNLEYKHVYLNWRIGLNRISGIKSGGKSFMDSIDNCKKALKLRPDISYAYNIWGTALLGLAEIKKDEALFLESIEKFKKSCELNAKDVEEFQFLIYIYGLYYMRFNKKNDSNDLIRFLKIIETEKHLTVLNRWIILILSTSNSLNENQLDFLNDIANNNVNKIPELKITEKYILNYKRYILENDKKAIYDLPKEQRIFFEEEILGLK